MEVKTKTNLGRWWGDYWDDYRLEIPTITVYGNQDFDEIKQPIGFVHFKKKRVRVKAPSRRYVGSKTY